VVHVESIGGLVKQRGEPHIFGVFRDITERKQAEDALRESERFLRSTLDGLSANIALLDEQGKILLVNKAWREFAENNGILSLSAVSEGSNYLQICDSAFGESSEEAGPFAEGIRDVLSGVKKSYVLEYPCHSPDKKRWFVGRITPFPGDGPRRVVVAHEDITEHKLAEMELRESEERYRALVEISSESLLLRDNEGKIVYANPSAITLLHATKAENLVGQNYLNLVHPDDREESAERTQRSSMENRPVPRREHRLIRLDDQIVHVESTGFPINYKGKQHVLGVFHDLTARKLAEEEHKKVEAQFRQAQKMEAVGRLAGGVAHDFNNMLGVILGFTDLAITKLPADDPVKMYLDEVKTAAQRSADITRQLLAFARKQTIAPQVLELNDTIASMLKMLRRLIGEDIDLLWKPANDLWPVKMDPAQIDQVLANMMVNARDAIPGVGKITIETGKVEFDEHYCKAHVGFIPGRYVLLAVSDDGCGMDKETLAQLFEPFFTTKEVGKGTGLGMATIYGIVKQNNGFIYVYSEPGQGTSFKIYLPRQEPQEAASELPPKPAEVPTGTEIVLLVEDEKSLLKFARMLLEELGYTVLAAGSPREAIQLAKEYTNEIHLLMTDVVMPEMSGRDLWEQLEASQPGLKCLFMSGYTANVIAHHGVLDDDLHFLQKPFSRAALATKMREALS
jgi:PAS domain S-box-containing protein